MPTLLCPWPIAGVSVLGCLGLVCLGVGLGRAQPNPAPLAGKEKKTLTPLYLPARLGCGNAGCHSSVPQPDETSLCRCDEYPRWIKNDKHADAYRALQSKLGRKMADRLGHKAGATKEPACLACHSVVVSNPSWL